MLRALGISVIEPYSEHEHPQIFVTYVNAVTLDIKIEGRRVKIEWADDLRAHLDFDEDTRTLFLFKYPSICAPNLLQGGSRSIFDRLWDNYQLNVESVAQKSFAFYHEVLLSYRIVFG
ncbi:hypothetical protein ANO14919_082550 [Xylariales sp. No.14919]|nr:hypothetical protein ANO14919_082550 [Xylariales sp. No.14919]